MASVNELLRDAAISHAVDLAHYSNGVVRRIIGLLNRADADLFAQLTEALDRLPAESFTVDRLERLLKSVRELNAEAYRQVERELTKELRDFAAYEAGYQLKLFEATIPAQVQVAVGVAAVNPTQVYSAAMARPFQIAVPSTTAGGKSVTLRQYIEGLSADRMRQIRNTIQHGYVSGDTTDQIIRRIRGTAKAKYADGLLDASRRHVAGMTQTALSHMANFTQQRALEANTGLLKGWEFLATLDGRTTITCASLSGKVFPIGKGPIPPRHINCRSFAVPVTKSWRELGIDIDEAPKSTRASMDGQVAADLSFSDWLRSKPADFQDRILGRTRGRMFRANEIEIDRFTNNRGQVYTLDELRQRRPELFEGIDTE